MNASEFLQPRNRTAHKGDFGRVLIVAGSAGMMGAAILAGKAALRTGSGLVRLCVPRDQFIIAQVGLPEATCMAREDFFTKTPNAAAPLEGIDAIVVGPGMGLGTDAADFLRELVRRSVCPMVLDADALTLLSRDGSLTLRPNCVLTPHVGEAARLLSVSAEAVEGEREGAVQSLADRYGCVAVLKGHETLIAAPGAKAGDIYRNLTGNPGMATGGSGDVLSGVIGSLLGQGVPVKDAAMLGVYLHGLAGDLAAAEIGEAGLMSGDLPLYVAMAIKKVAGQKDNL